MSIRRRVLLVPLALVACTVAAAPGALGGAGNTADRSASPVTLAVIGDVPYGTAREARFGELVGAVDDDPEVGVVVHVGDVKSGFRWERVPVVGAAG